MQSSNEPVTYIDPTAGRHVQLDGLRTLAMMGVLYVHFWNSDPVLEHARVSLFFTVSGFLITMILLKARARGATGLRVAVNFYIRRALRLFPALVLLVVVAWWTNAEDARASIGWHALQASNFYFYANETWDPWVFAHLWSLNNLEQFYLIWPLVILLLPKRAMWAVVIGLLLLPVALRLSVGMMGVGGWARILPLYTFDPIAAGSLLAMVRDHDVVARHSRNPVVVVAALSVLGAPFLLGEAYGAGEMYRALSVAALVVIVAGAYHGYGGPLNPILGNRVMRYASQISYAVFIYHLMLWWLLVQFVPALYDREGRTFFVMLAVSVAMAALSWHVYERPISRLKSRFPVV
ncbi:hypothetical protein ACMU_08635 [Actibacterium mucosum KCTC 23349]|uniref:Acyltransferase 3 domain-containing protein n=1 Tax=Actibacterium mucosum KCTC 23349 TaxID=1454373 RepID=A0A037ZJN9_9RHOB|nr:acyltransferase [Actibacterium mucosum]KAJ55829.1 hypothetical protein ACMU_08635 [Actibacterium mucosum KCTC 23349]